MCGRSQDTSRLCAISAENMQDFGASGRGGAPAERHGALPLCPGRGRQLNKGNIIPCAGEGMTRTHMQNSPAVLRAV